MPEAKQFSTTLGGHTVTLETGRLANLAGGAVTIRAGDTLLLATATMSREPREGIDFFPLSVDYEERLYAAGVSRARSSGAKAARARARS
jgi:polyribonucleotide nucleotidyltransferase